MAAATLAADGMPRFVWEDVPVQNRDYVRVMLRSVREAHRWRRQYQEAKAAGGGTGQPRRGVTGLWTAIRQPHPRVLPTASRIPGRLAGCPG